MTRIVRRDRFVLLGILLAVVLGFAGVAWGLHRIGYRINITASHPYGLYRIVDLDPAVGLYAIFCAPLPVAELPPLDKTHPPCTRDTDGTPFLKRIVRVENGRYYVRGDHPRSLDSRVFGPLRRGDIDAVAVVVWAY